MFKRGGFWHRRWLMNLLILLFRAGVVVIALIGCAAETSGAGTGGEGADSSVSALLGEGTTWQANPDKVSCIYSENALLHSQVAKAQPLDNLEPLAKAGVPLWQESGSEDPFLEKNTWVLEERYRGLGGSITVVVKEGAGHYPLGPRDLERVVVFIAKSAGL
jgi:hypothetical protein